MKKTHSIFCFIFLAINFSFGQFKPNSFGVCYLQKDTADYYLLSIVLPFQMLENQSLDLKEFPRVLDTLAYSGLIVFFDKGGELCGISDKQKFLLEFWCENDGGTQYRPTLRVTIEKNKFKRPLGALSEMQNICCFVLVNAKTEQPGPILKPAPNTKLMGDFNSDGKADCLIYAEHDDAENCGGEPKNNLLIVLRTLNQDYWLRCCGP